MEKDEDVSHETRFKIPHWKTSYDDIRGIYHYAPNYKDYNVEIPLWFYDGEGWRIIDN